MQIVVCCNKKKVVIIISNSLKFVFFISNFFLFLFFFACLFPLAWKSTKNKSSQFSKNYNIVQKKKSIYDKVGPSSKKLKSGDVSSCSDDWETSQPVMLHDNSTS